MKAICLRNDEFELKKFRQPPQVEVLADHLRRSYPGAQNRIKSMIDFYGIKRPEEFENSRSKKSIAWLEELEFKNTSAKSSLLLLLKQYKATRKLVVPAQFLKTLAATAT